MSVQERGPQGPENVDWLNTVTKALESQEFDEAFRSTNPAPRGEFITKLHKAVQTLKAQNIALAKEQSEQWSREHRLKGETAPEIIKRLFRRGKYLELPSAEELENAPYPLTIKMLISKYSRSIQDFQQQSLAHLCPPSHQLYALERGTLIGNEHRQILTIPQLRRLLPELVDDNSKLWFKMNHGRINLGPLFKELEAWDQIQEERGSLSSEGTKGTDNLV